MWINGEFVGSASKQGYAVVNPATEIVVETVPCGAAEDVEKAMAAANAAFKGWRKLGIEGLDEFREPKHVLIDYKIERKKYWFPYDWSGPRKT
jgi:acyl-CoA reductase-like NAD-dependent aldehyde dehydrogenase